MDFDGLILSPKMGMKFVAAAKEIVRSTVKVKQEKEYQSVFMHRGFYGSIKYFDMVTLVSVRISKKMKYPICDSDYELIKTINETSEKYHGMLEINSSRNTCSARTVLFLDAGFDKEIFLSAVNDCCDNLEAFFKAYNMKSEYNNEL